MSTKKVDHFLISSVVCWLIVVGGIWVICPYPLISGLFTFATFISVARQHVTARRERERVDEFWSRAQCPSCGHIYGSFDIAFPKHELEDASMVPDVSNPSSIATCPKCYSEAEFFYDSYTLEPYRRLRTLMPLTRQESRKEIVELLLPPTVLSVFDGQLPHSSLSYRCQDPRYIFSTPLEPEGVHITPLWECGVSVTAYQHTQPRGRFVTLSLEHSEDVVVSVSGGSTIDRSLGGWGVRGGIATDRRIIRVSSFRQVISRVREQSRFGGVC